MAAIMRAARSTASSCSTRLPDGFTLVELAVVLAIGAILVSIAAPSMSAMLATQRSNSAVNALLTGLGMARNEAIKRNARAVLCKSGDGLACAAEGGWEQGWILFQDANNNARRDANEAILQRQAAVPQLQVRGNAPVAAYVSYSASGSAKRISGAFQAGTFTVCQVGGSKDGVRQVVLSPTGRVRLQKGASSDCP